MAAVSNDNTVVVEEVTDAWMLYCDAKLLSSFIDLVDVFGSVS